jgi:hypothetical protein
VKYGKVSKDQRKIYVGEDGEEREYSAHINVQEGERVDTEFLPEEVVDKFKFRSENLRVSEAGEDVIEEPVVEPTLESIPNYDEDAHIQYAGGLSEEVNLPDDTLAE